MAPERSSFSSQVGDRVHIIFSPNKLNPLNSGGVRIRVKGWPISS
jgi:hypothetical protein